MTHEGQLFHYFFSCIFCCYCCSFTFKLTRVIFTSTFTFCKSIWRHLQGSTLYLPFLEKHLEKSLIWSRLFRIFLIYGWSIIEYLDRFGFYARLLWVMLLNNKEMLLSQLSDYHCCWECHLQWMEHYREHRCNIQAVLDRVPVGRAKYFTISTSRCSGWFQSEIDIQISTHSFSTQPDDGQQWKAIKCRRISFAISSQLYGWLIHRVYYSCRGVHTSVPFQFGRRRLLVPIIPHNFQRTGTIQWCHNIFPLFLVQWWHPSAVVRFDQVSI